MQMMGQMLHGMHSKVLSFNSHFRVEQIFKATKFQISIFNHEFVCLNILKILDITYMQNKIKTF